MLNSLGSVLVATSIAFSFADTLPALRSPAPPYHYSDGIWPGQTGFPELLPRIAGDDAQRLDLGRLSSFTAPCVPR
jgi:hypothetical protein